MVSITKTRTPLITELILLLILAGIYFFAVAVRGRGTRWRNKKTFQIFMQSILLEMFNTVNQQKKRFVAFFKSSTRILILAHKKETGEY